MGPQPDRPVERQPLTGKRPGVPMKRPCRRGHDPRDVNAQGRCRRCRLITNLEAVERYKTTARGMLVNLNSERKREPH